MKMRSTLVLGLLLALLLAGQTLAADDLVGAAYGAFEGGIRNMLADHLYEILCDGDPSDDPLIIDVRTPEDYERGHIQGAVRYDLAQVFQPEVLETLPRDRQIVLYCYTGQSSSWAVGVLRMMGYDAYNLFWGMSGWSANPEIYARRFDPSTVPDYPTTKEPAYAIETYPMPTPLADTLGEAAVRLFSEGIAQYNLTATQVHEWLHDDDPANDPMILCVQQAVSYERGHIPGAIQIEPEQLFTPENLAKLPPDRRIVVYRYTGQGSAKVAAALRILGYDAYHIQWGMAGWSADPEVYVQRFEPADVKDYRTEGTLVYACATLCEPCMLPQTGSTQGPSSLIVAGLGFAGIVVGSVLRRRNARPAEAPVED